MWFQHACNPMPASISVIVVSFILCVLFSGTGVTPDNFRSFACDATTDLAALLGLAQAGAATACAVHLKTHVGQSYWSSWQPYVDSAKRAAETILG